MSFTSTDDNGTIYSNAYAKKYGSYMFFFITLYTADRESSMNDLLDSITKTGQADKSGDTSSTENTAAAAADSTTSDRLSPKVKVG